MWAAVIFCGMVVGFTKSGIPGIGILAVPLMAMVFPPGPSAGIFLPMLIMGDILAVAYYRRNAQWRFVVKPLLWAAVGIGAAFLVIKVYSLNDKDRLLGNSFLDKGPNVHARQENVFRVWEDHPEYERAGAWVNCDIGELQRSFLGVGGAIFKDKFDLRLVGAVAFDLAR